MAALTRAMEEGPSKLQAHLQSRQVPTPGTSPGSSPQRRTPVPSMDPALVSDLSVATDSTCSPECTLMEVTKLLVQSMHTAAVIVDKEGMPLGVVTQASLMRASFTGVPFDSPVGKHFQCDVNPLSVPPEATVLEAAKQLVSTAAPGDDVRSCGAVHVLVVRDFDGKCTGVLSPLDLAGALRWTETPQHELEMAGVPVTKVMEPKNNLAVCSPASTFRQVLAALLASRSGAVLVADMKGVHGLITSRDALHAISDGVKPCAENVWAQLAASQTVSLRERLVASEAALREAATVMSSHGLQHLVIVEPGQNAVVGLLGWLDLLHLGLRDAAELWDLVRPPPMPVLVGDIIQCRRSAVCQDDATMTDACDVMVSAGRTAAVVVDRLCEAVGVLTENDVLQALVEGADWDCGIDMWLRGGEARMPGFLMPAVTAKPNTPLADAASQMALQTKGDFACHHLPVRDDAGRPLGLISALDIARGLCKGAHRGGPRRCAVDLGAEISAAAAMKPRATVPTCRCEEPLMVAFKRLHESKQNCLLVIEGEEGTVASPQESANLGINAPGIVVGVVTSADVLRAFAEHLPPSTAVGRWLRGVGTDWAQRKLRPYQKLSEAVEAMDHEHVHHMLVTECGSEEVVGVVSALDVVLTLSSIHLAPPEASTGCHLLVCSAGSLPREGCF